jgi:hypothetical protein
MASTAISEILLRTPFNIVSGPVLDSFINEGDTVASSNGDVEVLIEKDEVGERFVKAPKEAPKVVRNVFNVEEEDAVFVTQRTEVREFSNNDGVEATVVDDDHDHGKNDMKVAIEDKTPDKSTGNGEESEGKSAGYIALRTLDVVLFMIEKGITEGLPVIAKSGSVA